MTIDAVWVSSAMMDSTLIEGYVSDVFEADKDLALETMRLSSSGIPLPEARFPKRMYGQFADETLGLHPHFFMAGGFWIVTDEFAAVLKHFDLGKTKLYPIELFQYDRSTPVDGTYFCLAFGERKQSFQPDASANVQLPLYPSKEPYWLIPAAPNDGDFTLTSIELDGPDLWIEPNVYDAFFLGNKLVAGLKTANLTKRLGLYKCRVRSL